MPQPHIVQAALRTIAALPGYPNLHVLDLSCGEGEMLLNLHRDGCQCQGSRYRSDDYIIDHDGLQNSEITVTSGVDLHQTLPYEDNTFDVVVMTEVLEHLGTHHSVVHEAGRVLKPGGHYVFTTPNIQRLHSRWQFFLTGTHKLIRRRTGWDIEPDDLYAYHINPVSFPLMHTLIHQGGMQVEKLGWTMFKWRHASWFLLYPLYALATWLLLGGKRKDTPRYREGERDLRRWMAHPAMLGSEQLLVVARKEAKTAGKATTRRAA